MLEQRHLAAVVFLFSDRRQFWLARCHLSVSRNAVGRRECWARRVRHADRRGRALSCSGGGACDSRSAAEGLVLGPHACLPLVLSVRGGSRARARAYALESGPQVARGPSEFCHHFPKLRASSGSFSGPNTIKATQKNDHEMGHAQHFFRAQRPAFASEKRLPGVSNRPKICAILLAIAENAAVAAPNNESF